MVVGHVVAGVSVSVRALVIDTGVMELMVRFKMERSGWKEERANICRRYKWM